MRNNAVFERLMTYAPAERAKAIRRLSGPQKREYVERWWQWAHEGQAEPEGDWRIWLIQAGRGFGKTRAGAEWVHARARANPDARIALVGGSEADVHRVMIEGSSGLLAVVREDEEMVWHRSAGELIFPGGARAYVYSAGSADALRGPEHDFAWCDELAKWGGAGEVAWDNLMLGLRLGAAPQTLVTLQGGRDGLAAERRGRSGAAGSRAHQGLLADRRSLWAGLPGRGGGAGGDPQCRGALEQGAARQCRAAFGRAGP